MRGRVRGGVRGARGWKRKGREGKRDEEHTLTVGQQKIRKVVSLGTVIWSC